MKCIDVQSELWSGRKSAQLDDHLATCVNCQREMADIQQIVGSLRAIEVPAPTRSLIPQREVIEQAVKHNRRQPWKRISTIAAAATVVLGIGTGLAMNHLQSGPSDTNAAGKNIDKQTTTSADLVTVKTKDDPELMQALKQYFEQNAPAEGVTHIDIQQFIKDSKSTNTNVNGVLFLDISLKQDAKTTKFIGGGQKQVVQFQKNGDGNWSVIYGYHQNDDALYSPEKRIEAYFQKGSLPNGVKAITVRSFTPDAQTEDKILTGKVTLQVDLMPNQSGEKPVYQQGLNERYVLLTKIQGVWEVDKLGTQPFKVTEAPEGTRDFNKVAQIMYGTLTEVHISPQDESGKDVPHLEYVKLMVEKNATTSNDTDKGKELMIAFSFNLAPSYTPKTGERVAVFVAKADPRVTAGMETWYGQREYYYYEKNGQYYDLVGQQTDPLQAYAKIQMSR